METNYFRLHVYIFCFIRYLLWFGKLGNGQPIDNIVFLLFGFVFFGISWGFFKRKSWAFKWGMWTGGINVIYNIYLGTYTWILYWGFALWLVYTSKEELVNS
jgi:hypothetical protein